MAHARTQWTYQFHLIRNTPVARAAFKLKMPISNSNTKRGKEFHNKKQRPKARLNKYKRNIESAHHAEHSSIWKEVAEGRTQGGMGSNMSLLLPSFCLVIDQLKTSLFDYRSTKVNMFINVFSSRKNILWIACSNNRTFKIYRSQQSNMLDLPVENKKVCWTVINISNIYWLSFEQMIGDQTTQHILVYAQNQNNTKQNSWIMPALTY